MNQRLAMHRTTFDHVVPSDDQLLDMRKVRQAFADCAGVLETIVPDGPDKTYLLRKFRECCMWANVAITRHPDGSPRT